MSLSRRQIENTIAESLQGLGWSTFAVPVASLRSRVAAWIPTPCSQ